MRLQIGRCWIASILAATLLPIGCSRSADQDSTASTQQDNSPLLIEPNVAVGKIHAGMQTADAIAVLGQPERKAANALIYPRRGFALMPGANGVIQVVMCGDVTGPNGPFVKAFTGRTKEGIGMNSTRDEIVKAYGQPTSAEALRGQVESLRYDPLGITFTLERGKVYHMIVRLRGTNAPVTAPPDSMSVDLAPPAK